MLNFINVPFLCSPQNQMFQQLQQSLIGIESCQGKPTHLIAVLLFLSVKRNYITCERQWHAIIKSTMHVTWQSPHKKKNIYARLHYSRLLLIQIGWLHHSLFQNSNIITFLWYIYYPQYTLILLETGKKLEDEIKQDSTIFCKQHHSSYA